MIMKKAHAELLAGGCQRRRLDSDIVHIPENLAPVLYLPLLSGPNRILTDNIVRTFNFNSVYLRLLEMGLALVDSTTSGLLLLMTCSIFILMSPFLSVSKLMVSVKPSLTCIDNIPGHYSWYAQTPKSGIKTSFRSCKYHPIGCVGVPEDVDVVTGSAADV